MREVFSSPTCGKTELKQSVWRTVMFGGSVLSRRGKFDYFRLQTWHPDTKSHTVEAHGRRELVARIGFICYCPIWLIWEINEENCVKPFVYNLTSGMIRALVVFSSRWNDELIPHFVSRRHKSFGNLIGLNLDLISADCHPPNERTFCLPTDRQTDSQNLATVMSVSRNFRLGGATF